MKNFLIGIWGFIVAVLDEAHKDIRGKALLPPAIIAAIIGGAVTIGSKIAADVKAKRAAKTLDEQAAAEKLTSGKEGKDAVAVAKGVAKQGDPTLAAKQRSIKEVGANTIGKAVSSSGSTQEIINAAQGVQTGMDKANLTAQTQAGQYKFNAQKLVSDRYVSAGQLRLAGNAAIDQRTQAALSAIGANAQATTDSAQSLASMGVQAASFLDNGQGANKGVPFDINELS